MMTKEGLIHRLREAFDAETGITLNGIDLARAYLPMRHEHGPADELVERMRGAVLAQAGMTLTFDEVERTLITVEKRR